MSGVIVNLAPRRAVKAASERAAHVDAVVGVVVSAIDQMREMGADSRTIAQTLRVIAKVLETEPQ
jgi:hypothetical protein